MSLGEPGKLAFWQSRTFKRQRKHGVSFRPGLEGLEERVLLTGGIGIPGFQPRLALPAGSAPNSAATGDFNHDGKDDAVIANFSSANLTLALSTGNGAFGTPLTIQTGNGPNGLAVADLLGNG